MVRPDLFLRLQDVEMVFKTQGASMKQKKFFFSRKVVQMPTCLNNTKDVVGGNSEYNLKAFQRFISTGKV